MLTGAEQLLMPCAVTNIVIFQSVICSKFAAGGCNIAISHAHADVRAAACRHILRRADFDAAYAQAVGGNFSAVQEMLVRLQNPF